MKQGIQFRDVSFRYPGTRREVLHSLNMDNPAGQVAAIVGPNGAGKSTLIKLPCHLYDPDTGSIQLDGVDLRNLPVEALRRHIAVLPQEYAHFNDTVTQNIALGDLVAAPDIKRIERAAQQAQADEFIQRLPAGYDSVLGNWFESGMELSVGEWQRIATARALVRQTPIIILDEPTSAMDPWTEMDWLSKLRELVNGRTAILITHRLTTAMRADVIPVMQDGRLIESGTHDQLLAADGRYAELWKP